MQHAVARHVGVDDRGNPGILETAGNIERRQFRTLGPALDRDLTVARIETDRDLARKFLRRLFHQFRIAHRGGTDDDAVDALLQPALDGRHVADAATKLHALSDRFENALDRRDVHRLASKGAVEIDDMQMLEALHLECRRLLRRIAMKHGGARHVALLQADGKAFLEIDGRK